MIENTSCKFNFLLGKISDLSVASRFITTVRLQISIKMKAERSLRYLKRCLQRKSIGIF